jgi:hypothetical protein
VGACRGVRVARPFTAAIGGIPRGRASRSQSFAQARLRNMRDVSEPWAWAWTPSGIAAAERRTGMARRHVGSLSKRVRDARKSGAVKHGQPGGG